MGTGSLRFINKDVKWTKKLAAEGSGVEGICKRMELLLGYGARRVWMRFVGVRVTVTVRG